MTKAFKRRSHRDPDIEKVNPARAAIRKGLRAAHKDIAEMPDAVIMSSRTVHTFRHTWTSTASHRAYWEEMKRLWRARRRVLIAARRAAEIPRLTTFKRILSN